MDQAAILSPILEVLNPVAANQAPQSFQLSARPHSLEGKTVGLIWNSSPNGDIALKRVGELIQARVKNVTVMFYSGTRPLRQELLLKAQQECDVFVGLSADCGGCASWMAHDMIQLERASKPAIPIVSHGFETLVDVKAKTLGVPLQYVVVPNNYKSLAPEHAIAQTEPVVDEIVRLLTTTPTHREAAKGIATAREIIPFQGVDKLDAYDRFNETFLENDWSDGYPLFCPTPERVREVLRGTTLNPQDVVCIMPPGNGIATVEKIAINAAMAGCRPEHLPVVIAGLRAILKITAVYRQSFLTSTSAHASLFLVTGPIAEELGVNGARCCLGPGRQNAVNITIGRALMLALRNIGHLYPGLWDMDTIGSPRKFNFCMAENSNESPWDPFHVDQGYPLVTNAITVFPTLGERDVSFNGQLSAEHLLRQISLHIDGGHNGDGFLDTRGDFAQPEKGRLLLLPPIHAQTLADGGFSKKAAKEFLYHTVTRSARQHLEVIRKLKDKVKPQWQWLAEMPEAEAEKIFLPILESADLYHIVVAGSDRPKDLICPLYALPATVEIADRA